MHPATKAVLEFFAYEHLPSNLQRISRPFSDLAHEMVKEVGSDPESTVGLRKLLEAKDCMVRAKVRQNQEG